MSSISSFDEHLNILMKNSLVWRLYSSSYHGLYQFYSLDALRYYNPLHLQATNLHLNSFIFHNCCGKSEILYTKVKISFQLFIPSMNVCQGPHHQILIFLYILIWKCNQYFIKALKEGHSPQTQLLAQAENVSVILEMESETLQSKRQLLTLAKTVGVRLMFLLHCLLAVSRVSDILNKPLFWTYSLFVLFLILDGIHAVCRRNGLEHKW